MNKRFSDSVVLIGSRNNNLAIIILKNKLLVFQYLLFSKSTGSFDCRFSHVYWDSGTDLNADFPLLSQHLPGTTADDLGDPQTTCDLTPCADIYYRPFAYCRRRQFMLVLATYIVALKHILRRRQYMAI